MTNFARIIYDSNVEARVDESIFPDHKIHQSETTQVGYIDIPLPRELDEQECDEFVDKMAAYLYEQGLDDFDIEISDLSEDDIEEITIEDDDDFHEWFGVLGYSEEADPLWEAEYRGRKVKLNKPMRGDVKKFKVYVKNPKGNVVKVNFGDPNMRIKKSNPARRRSFRARHNCDNPGPKHKARYWSCRAW